MIHLSSYALRASAAEGKTKLTAFDNALLQSGVGNLNLIRVSSILPPNMTLHHSLDSLPPPGSLLPIAYGSIVSDVPGTLISAAVGIGFGEKGEYGVIMECSGEMSKDDSVEIIYQMLEESFVMRGRDLLDYQVHGVEHVVENIGCAFAAVPMWWS